MDICVNVFTINLAVFANYYLFAHKNCQNIHRQTFSPQMKICTLPIWSIFTMKTYQSLLFNVPAVELKKEKRFNSEQPPVRTEL